MLSEVKHLKIVPEALESSVSNSVRPFAIAQGDNKKTFPVGEIPCFRCGVCCVKWQPLLSPQEIRCIASDMGLSVRTFKRRYLRRYPMRRGWYIIKADSQGCLFLGFDGPLATCTIYDFRPEVCRSWEASLARSECQEGLSKMATAVESEKKEIAFGRDEFPA